MPKSTVSLELSFHIKAARTGDLPLEIYDALYYSGRFEPIYRMQGDMVLSAFYNPPGSRESGLRRAGRRILRELTIDSGNRPRGQEVRIENLMPVSEEENSFYREPKVRISCKADSVVGRAQIERTVVQGQRLLEETENVLLSVQGLERTEDARISLTLRNGVFDAAGLKDMSSGLKNSNIICSSAKRTWSLNFRRNLLQEVVIPAIASALSTLIAQE